MKPETGRERKMEPTTRRELETPMESTKKTPAASYAGWEMTLTAMEFMIILDTIQKSTRIHDTTGLFGYTKDTRALVAKKLRKLLDRVEIPFELEPER